VIKQWTKLINGLRIRQRLQEQYSKGDRPQEAGSPEQQDTAVGAEVRYETGIPCIFN